MFPLADRSLAGARPGRRTRQGHIYTPATSFASNTGAVDSQTRANLRYIFDTLGSTYTAEETLIALQTCDHNLDAAILKLLNSQTRRTRARQTILGVKHPHGPLENFFFKPRDENMTSRSHSPAEDRRILDICDRIRCTNAQLSFIFGRYDAGGAYSRKKDIINQEFEGLLKEQRYLLQLTCAGRDLHGELETASSDHENLPALVKKRLNMLLARIEENDQLMNALAEELDRTLKRVNALDSADSVHPLHPPQNHPRQAPTSTQPRTTFLSHQTPISTQPRKASVFSQWMSEASEGVSTQAKVSSVLEDPFSSEQSNSSQDNRLWTDQSNGTYAPSSPWFVVHEAPRITENVQVPRCLTPKPTMDLLDLNDKSTVVVKDNAFVMSLKYHSDVRRFRYPILFAPAPSMAAELESRRVMLTDLPYNISYAQLLRGVRGWDSQATASIFPSRKVTTSQNSLPPTECALVEFTSHDTASAFVRFHEGQPLTYCEKDTTTREALARLVPTNSYRVISSGRNLWYGDVTCALDVHGLPNKAVWFFFCTVGVRHITHVDFDETTNVWHIEFVAQIYASNARRVLEQSKRTTETVFENLTVSFSPGTTGHGSTGESIPYIPPDFLEVKYNCAPHNQYPFQAQEDLIQYSGPASEDSSSSPRATPSVEDTSETEESCGDTRESSCIVEQDTQFTAPGIKDIRKWEQYGVLARQRDVMAAAPHKGNDYETEPCGTIGFVKECCDLKKAPIAQVIRDFLNPIDDDLDGL
ncbi:hypothetical protein HJFPF1_06148 [Paramyrothecium foliicola]|nr:hypothetical protein HJFPF1_06148 [Paramyrothecium foliicola]